MWQCYMWILYFCVFLVNVTCFNIESFNYAIYTGPDTSLFGFSLTLHKESGRGWLIVGAPEAQSSYQPNVRRGGAVFKCPTDRDGSCEEIPFDTEAQRLNSENQPYDNKTEQWFGATVSGSGTEDGRIVACAPRYFWYPKQFSRRDPVGTCWVSNGHFTHFNEYSPCRTFQWGYHRQGSCQAGFSAAINSAGDRLFIGAPGSWYWQGQMFSIDANAWFEFKPLSFTATYGAKGQVHQQSLEVRPAVFSTTEGSEKDDVSYMGYSTVVGDFIGDGEQGIAVGVPRGNGLKGQVRLFTWNLTNYHYHFSSDQLGSYYGYALAASDVDGDNKIDLIVSAPMYTPLNSEGKYDVGRVYVIYHNSNMGKFVATYVIDGFNTKSRFGQALANLGDINKDGFGDFAVGAPYDGPNERGAVYIYHGSKKGVRKKYSQVIYGEDIQPLGPFSNLYTFGFAITGGMDLDGNEYPDMAVGAYSSNNAYYFRSRPVVLVEAHVLFLTPGKEIDIKKTNYKLRKGGMATVTSIDFCIKYRGEGIPEYLDLNLQYILDSKKPKGPRMGFVENENTNILNDTIRLAKDTQKMCINKEVFVKSDIKDKLTPLVAEVKYWMNEDSTPLYYQRTRNPRSVLQPILDLNSPPSRKDSISVHKDCGPDNICIPDLSLSVKSNVDQYLLGSTDNLTFDVIVANKGEDSFESILEVKYPQSVYYSYKTDQLESHVLCNTYENNTLRCELGNPIPKRKVVRFSIFWQPDIVEGMAPSYEFDLYVNSTNQELNKTLKDNYVHVSIGIWSNSTLDITGNSYPSNISEIYFNSSLYTTDISIMSKNISFEKRLHESVIGPQVTHVYYLTNKGPATIKETEVFFVWPSKTLGGEDFLYLLEPPHFSPSQNVQCDSIVANHLNFNIDQNKKSIWERLRLSIAETASSSDHTIGSTIGGGTSKNDQFLNREIDSSGDASLVHQRRQNASWYQTGGSEFAAQHSSEDQQQTYSNGITHHTGPNQTITHTSTRHYKIKDGIKQITENNKTEIKNGSGTFVKYQSNGNLDQNVFTPDMAYSNYQHGLQNVGLNRGYQMGNSETSGSKTFASGEIIAKQTSGEIVRQSYLDDHQLNQDFGATSYDYDSEEHDQSINGKNYGEEIGPTSDDIGGVSSLGDGFGVTTLDLGTFGMDRQYLGKNSEDLNGNYGSGGSNQNQWKQESHWSQNQQIPPNYVTRVMERDNVPTDRPIKNQRFYGRKKRQVAYNPYPDIKERYPCKNVECYYMRCVVGSLKKDKTITIALRSRINARVLRNVSSTQPTTFSSVMAARISKLPYIGQPLEQQLYFHEIISTVSPQKSEIKPDVVPLWVVVLSAVAGTIILLLLVFLLYKAGFFKRNRPSNAPERQPLNRNGYHHGDEAL